MNGSSREPNFDDVRRTPFATARILPCCRDSIVTMRSASGFQGQRRLDWLGVAIIGIMIGMGGGLIRDILLGQTPATLQNQWYLVTAAGAALLGMLLGGLFTRLNAAIVALDAIVIGMFGAFGTSKALALGLPPVPAVFVGVCSAVGGGILRD